MLIRRDEEVRLSELSLEPGAGRDPCYLPPGACDTASRLKVGDAAYEAGTSHMRAAYHTAQATMNSDMTQTHTGIAERASARRGSNGSSVLNASTVKRTVPLRIELGRRPETMMPG